MEVAQSELESRDYFNILLPNVEFNGREYNPMEAGEIAFFRDDVLKCVHGMLDQPRDMHHKDLIDQIFAQEGPIDSTTGEIEYNFTYADKVRYIRAIPTTMRGDIIGIFVSNDLCNVFLGNGEWYSFASTKRDINGIISENLGSGSDEYRFVPKLNDLGTFRIHTDGDWVFKMLNRSGATNQRMVDAFAIHCDNDSHTGIWYIPQIGVGVCSPAKYGIKDIAYEQGGNRLYVLFDGGQTGGMDDDSNCLYAYDNIQSGVDYWNVAVLTKETANMRIRTFNSIT